MLTVEFSDALATDELRALQCERVVLVDVRDRQIGVASKLAAHQQGQLHRAFSALVFDSRNTLLLQRRAAGKYHSGGLWSNTCCGHPRPGEPTVTAAQRRLREELGLTCALAPAFTFLYRAELSRDMYEHELDHVVLGVSDECPVPDPREVCEWRRVDLGTLRREMAACPAMFTVWFHVLMQRLHATLPASDFTLAAQEHLYVTA
jgi:isopentenyl-diphosphate Delta-isomerase